MKVYTSTIKEGSYSGGLVIVAANSPQEALDSFIKYGDYGLRSVDSSGCPTLEEIEIDHYVHDCFDLTNWIESQTLITTVETPQVLYCEWHMS